jgi:hypothetical protein
MARTRSLQDLIADVRWAADAEGTTRRHTDEKITRALNQGQQAFRLMVSDAGHTFYLTQGGGVMTIGDDRVYALPGDFVAIYGVDLVIDDEAREMYEFQISERNKFGGAYSDIMGAPVAWRLEGADLMRVSPTPDAAYPFYVWYLPRPDDMTGTFNSAGTLTASTSSFDGIAGWEDWLVYDTAMRITARDTNSEKYQMLAAELTRITSRILVVSRKRQRAGPIRRTDTRGRRRAVEASARRST